MIETLFRRIISSIPHPESVDLLAQLDRIEPQAMHGQPPVIWARANGFIVEDPFGNKFIDFTSGVLLSNCGHNHPRVNKAIAEQLDRGLLASYIFPTQERVLLLEALLRHAPIGLDQALLFSTGAEAVEAALKLAKQQSKKVSSTKSIVISFEGSFHGRTLGAQLAGGIPMLKSWIEPNNMHFIQLPFPDPDDEDLCHFSTFECALTQREIRFDDVCAVMFETYQGGVVKFASSSFVQQLRTWCTKHRAILIFDEVQSGFGRTGKWWGFEHYEVIPDLIACGKGISGSLPLSAVIGSHKIMNIFPPGAMSTTHSGNPLCCVAATASIEVLEAENLIERCALLGQHVASRLQDLANQLKPVGLVSGRGLVYGIHIVDANKHPDSQLAQKIVMETVRRGVILFNPVGLNGATIKINPPLCITQEAFDEGLDVFQDAVEAACEM